MRFRIKTFLTLAALLVLPLLLLLWGGQAHGLSASEVENNVLGGRQTIIDWERAMWNVIRDCHNRGDYGGNHRTCVNQIAYMNWMWIMAKNGNTNVVEVDSGTHEVTFRIKTLLFYTSAVVSPTGAWDWYDYGSQWVVREDNFPNDRAPNFFTSDCGYLTTTGVNCPALTANYYQVNNAWVDNNSAGAYVKSFDSSIKDSGISRTTRYQFTPDSDLVIRSESGFVANQDTTVRISYKRARHYYNEGWVVCDSGGSLAHVNNASQCPADTTSAVIKVKVKAPIVEATSTVDNPSNNKSLAQTKKDSLGNGSGKTEINGRATPIGNGQQAVMTNNRPGQRLTWWFSAENKGPGPTLDSFDMMNFRAGWGNGDWDVDNFNDTNKVNWYLPPRIYRGQTHRYGCYDWGGTCTWNGTNLSLSQAESRKFSYLIGSNDGGKTLCQRVRLSWNEGEWKEVVTPNACAYVPYHYPSCDPGHNDCDNNPPRDCKWYGTCPNERITNYGVTPSVSNVGSGTAMMGDTVSFRYNITNNSSFTKTKNMNYKAYIFVVKGGENIANADGVRSYNGSVSVCNYNMPQSGRSISSSQIRSGVPCLTPLSGSTVVQAGGSWSGGTKSVTLNDAYLSARPGDQVCSYMTVDNWNVINDESSPSIVASNVACVRIGKRPQIQINGSDSYAKRGFTGSSFSITSALTSNKNHGSYSQYGLLTGSGTISNFGSAGYTVPGNNGMACRLAIANNASFVSNCTLVGRGGINKPLSIPAMPSETINFNDNSTTIQEIINSAGSAASTPGQYSFRFTGSGVLTINESSIPAGYDIQIFADHGVNINGNVGHDTPGSSTTVVDAGETKAYANLTKVPNLTVVARDGNINISSSVNYITGTYVAVKGSFNSCYNMDNLGITGNCNNKLKVNGAVVSKNAPKLHRTFGSGNNSNVNQWDGNTITSTSEWFNYTPNLWLSKYSSGSDTIDDFTTTSMNILPTRY